MTEEELMPFLVEEKDIYEGTGQSKGKSRRYHELQEY